MPGRKSFKVDHDDSMVRELENIREALCYSQRQMADSLGVPFRTYQKWVYSKHKPRHMAALLARARAMRGPRRFNCWEKLACGREPGGRAVDSHGPCPAAVDRTADGVNSGLNGGRVCWAIAGTFCGQQVQASEAARLVSCFSCRFFQEVIQEEGLVNFRLLKPGQTFTQR